MIEIIFLKFPLLTCEWGNSADEKSRKIHFKKLKKRVYFTIFSYHDNLPLFDHTLFQMSKYKYLDK